MKKYIYHILIVVFVVSYFELNAQEIFTLSDTNNEVIFLGNFDESGCLEVFDNNKIYFIENHKLEKTNELNPEEFLKLLNKNKLPYVFEGT